MFGGTLRRQRYGGQTEPTADRFGDIPEGDALLGDRVIGTVHRAAFHGKAEHGRRVEPVHRGPGVEAVTDIGRNALFARRGDENGNEAMIAPAMDRGRQAHRRRLHAARDELRYAIELPSGLSLLVHMDPAGVVQGLEEVPPEDRPPVNVVHYAFDLMVLCGVAALAYVGLGALLWLRRKPPWARRWFLRLGLAVAPLGLVAIEAGWTVTEVGRQPWIIHGFMRTADSVTPMPGLVSPLIVFTLLYVVLGVVVVALLRNHVLAATTTARADDDADPRALVTSGEREPGDSLRAALARDLHEEGPR